MKNLIGIVQGRLSISPKNRLQFFPKNWRKEFELANRVGFDFIEFFTERKKNKSNPVWDVKKLDEYKKKVNSKYEVISVFSNKEVLKTKKILVKYASR